MKLKLNLLTAAVAVLAAGAANANPTLASANKGDSSAMFVAMDSAFNISVAIDLNTTLSSFLGSTSLTSGAGALSAAGTVAQWNFAANTFTVNGVAQAGTTSWASPSSSFLTNANVTGNGYQWGVIAGDSINGAKSASNVLTGQNLLFTQSSIAGIDFAGVFGSALNDGPGNINLFTTALAGKGTNTLTVKGGATATAGDEFLGTTLAANGAADLGTGALGSNNFLLNAGETAYAVWATANSNAPTVYALGSGAYASSASAFSDVNAATFTWDGSTLTYTVPAAIPEPGTYALLLAGLGAVGFIGRRRANRG
jgi:hypothetical protein